MNVSGLNENILQEVVRFSQRLTSFMNGRCLFSAFVRAASKMAQNQTWLLVCQFSNVDISSFVNSPLTHPQDRVTVCLALQFGSTAASSTICYSMWKQLISRF